MFYGSSCYSKLRYFNLLEDKSIANQLEQGLQKSEPNWVGPYIINPDSIKKEVISYILPFEFQDEAVVPTSCLVFDFTTKSIERLLADFSQYSSSALFIHDDGQLIYSNQSNLKQQISFDRVQDEESDADTIVLDGKKYLLVRSDEKNGMQLTAVIDYFVVSSYVNTSLQLYFLYGVASIVLGALLIAFFVHFNYVPIRKLNQSIETLGIEMDSSGEYFDQLAHSIQQLSYSHTEIAKEQLNTQQDSILLKLFSTNFSEEQGQSIRQLANMIDINLNRKYFLCMLIAVQKLPEFYSAHNIEKGKTYDIYEYHHIHQNRIVLLFAFDNSKFNVMESFISSLGSAFDLQTKGVGVSLRKQNFLKISEAYREAVLACNVCCDSNKKILYYNDVSDKVSIDGNYILNESEALRSAIEAEEYDNVLLAYNALLVNLKTIENFATLQMFCFETLVKCIHTYQKLAEKPTLTTKHNLRKLYEQNIDADEGPIEILSETIKEIAVMIHGDAPAVKKLEIHDLLNTLQDHYLDSDFSIKGLAACYDISISNLSHFFKSKTDTTLSEYITDLKMIKVKQLLTETNEPIRDIAGQVGYLHTSNFIKKFKSFEGVTPQQFRKQNQ